MTMTADNATGGAPADEPAVRRAHASTPVEAAGARVGGAAVAVRNFTKRFDRVLAVDDVTLEIASGEFVSLLGPSGSGKTTLLMGIAGFEHPTSGRVEVGGEECTWRPANKRNLGMVFQKYTLFPHLSGYSPDSKAGCFVPKHRVRIRSQ